MEEKVLTAALFSLFDRQRFEGNERLASLIRETERRCDGHALSDDALLFVSAAGEQPPQRDPQRNEDERL